MDDNKPKRYSMHEWLQEHTLETTREMCEAIASRAARIESGIVVDRTGRRYDPEEMAKSIDKFLNNTRTTAPGAGAAMLQVGDSVQLPCGGPEMTVVAMRTDGVETMWFKPDMACGSGLFPAECLVVRNRKGAAS